jgi:hypothetical protein
VETEVAWESGRTPARPPATGAWAAAPIPRPADAGEGAGSAAGRVDRTGNPTKAKAAPEVATSPYAGLLRRRGKGRGRYSVEKTRATGPKRGMTRRTPRAAR